MLKPKLSMLWSKYPRGIEGCDVYQNQCAMRVSKALIDSGFPLSNYTDPKCGAYARGAESLANHLWRKWGRPDIYTNPLTAKGRVQGRKGIILFKDLFGGPGDHIDLWNGSGTKTGEYFKPCKQVWFFELN